MPASPHKKDLLNVLDRVPTFVQSLQFTVKDHTVGPSATFVKVDHVIRETKHLMCVINSVVTKCLDCATKVIIFNPLILYSILILLGRSKLVNHLSLVY